jgi:putative hydrolase of the HAD superfamily
MITTVFLDIGGIFLSNGWEHQSREKAARKFHLDFEEIEILHDFIFNVYEIGKLTQDEYLDTVIFNRERDFTREDFKTFMFGESVAMSDMLTWFKEWKRECGFRIISINNEGRELNDLRIKKFGLHQCFDAFISSCEVGMRKPDPGIFKLAMGIAQVSASECIYFDDRLMLVQAAEKQGIKSLHHQNFETTKKILMDLKIKNEQES